MTDAYPEEGIQMIPYSREAEEATLGSVLINPECYYDLNFLAPDDFYIHRHKWIWEAFAALSEERTPIDLLTVSEELDRSGKLAEIGGSAYLTSLINQVPSSLNAESYARIVEEHSTRRKLIAAANKIAAAAYDETTSAKEVQEIANREITSSISGKGNEIENFATAMSEVWDEAVKNANSAKDGKVNISGIKTGLIDLDVLLLGVEPEESVIIAARPGKGKSSLLFGIARHNALMEKKNVAIFSLEMSEKAVARRFISQQAKVDSTKIRMGTMDQEEWTRVAQAIELYQNGGRIFLSDIKNLTPATLRAMCIKLHRQYGLDLIILDYLQLMSAGIRSENRTREVGYISRHVKLLSGELGVPIFSAAQLSRGPENRTEKRPVLSDLRDSGDIEQDASTVIFLHFDEYGEKDVTEAIVAKRRDGPTGTIPLIYRRPFATFENATTKKFSPND